MPFTSVHYICDPVLILHVIASWRCSWNELQYTEHSTGSVAPFVQICVRITSHQLSLIKYDYKNLEA